MADWNLEIRVSRCTEETEKYRSKNPFVKFVVKNFFRDLLSFVSLVYKPNMKILDVGCGEGVIADIVQNNFDVSYFGLDISKERIYRGPRSIVGDIYNLPFHARSFDLVLCLEILEHLTDPKAAIEEVRRVSKAHTVVSVPNDWLFRLGNILRGKRLSKLGNGPGHIQHWGARSFESFLKKEFREIIRYKLSGTWLIALVAC